MKKHIIKNDRFFVILVASFFLFILAFGLIFSKPFKILKEVVAVGGTSVGQVNLNLSGTTYTPGGIWNSSGSVGIGTTNPGQKLDVNGAIKSSVALGENTPRFVWYDDGFSASYLSYAADAQTRFKSTSNWLWQSIGTGANIYTTGTTRMTLDTGGNIANTGTLTVQGTGNSSIAGSVGIGTTNPGAKLDVNGTLNTTGLIYGNGKEMFTTNDGFLRVNQGSAFSSGVWLGPSDLKMYTGHLYIGSQGSGGNIDMYGNGDATTRLTLDGSTGNITSAGYFRASGTGNPGAQTGGYTFSAPGDTDGGMGSGADGTLQFYTNSTEKVRINPSGKVGIGTVNPLSKLSVGGDGYNEAAIYGAGGTYGVYGYSPTNYGVAGFGQDVGVRGSGTNSYGVWGTSNTIGVYGQGGGYGVWGVGTNYDFYGNGAKTYFAGNVGIGELNPSVKLEVVGPIISRPGTFGNIQIGTPSSYNGIMITSNDANVYRSDIRRTYLAMDFALHASTALPPVRMSIANSGYVTFSNGHNDIAEKYLVTGQVQRGNLVSIDQTQSKTVTLSSPLHKTITGIVSTAPGAVMDEDGGFVIGAETKTQYKNEKAPIALLGTGPTLVASQNGIINIGDAIGISDIPGYGSKMITAGNTVGYAIEKLETNNTCQPVTSIESISWPEDNGKNSLKPCFLLPNGIYVGKIMVAIAPSWYDPDVYLTDSGDLKIVGDNNNYSLKGKNDSIITRIGSFAEVVSAKIRSGVIETKKLVVDGVDILKRLTELSNKIDTQQKQIDELQRKIESLKK